MKFVFASDSFKGSLSSVKINELLTEAAKSVFPDCETISVPFSDGGEGLIEALLACEDGKIIQKTVSGPLHSPTASSYAGFGDFAVIEMARASGLPLIKTSERNPLLTSTYGTGELILDAVKKGYKKIFVGLGGSATNDGGMGAMRALGVKFLDKAGEELFGRGEDLLKVTKIDTSGLDAKFKDVTVTAICDITNPLTGKLGATKTFGKQKGGDKQTLDLLERGMKNYAKVIERTFGENIENYPGGGAAGGLGAALKIFLNAKLKPGTSTMLELTHFKEKIEGADLIVTGEGEVNFQSCFGKVVSGIGQAGKESNIPVVAIVGSLGEGAEKIFEQGVSSVLTTINSPMSLEFAIENAEALYRGAALRLFKLVRALVEKNAKK